MGNDAQASGLPGFSMFGIFSVLSLAVSDMLFPLCMLYFWEICDTETVVKIFSIVASLVLSCCFCCFMSLLCRSVGKAASSLGVLEEDMEYRNRLVLAKFIVAAWNGN